jgi:hypothetical protein
MRIVDQAFPTNGGTWFLEIDPHDNPEVRGQFVDCGLQKCRILARSLGVVNRARTDDDKQTMILATENVADLRAGLINRGRCFFGDWHFFFEKNWRKNNFGPLDTNVIGAVEHGLPLESKWWTFYLTYFARTALPSRSPTRTRY